MGKSGCVNKPLTFIVWSIGNLPQYGGVCALHQLGDALTERGHRVILCAADKIPQYRGELILPEAVNDALLAGSVVVYPDLIPDAPLKGRP